MFLIYVMGEKRKESGVGWRMQSSLCQRIVGKKSTSQHSAAAASSRVSRKRKPGRISVISLRTTGTPSNFRSTWDGHGMALLSQL